MNPSTSTHGDTKYCHIHPYSIECRLGRVRYLAHLLLLNLGILVVALLVMTLDTLGIALGVIVYLAIFAGIMIANVQRLHDLGKSGWYILGMFIPLVNIVVIIYLFFCKGTEGQNQYGNPPPPHKMWHVVVAIGVPLFLVVLVSLSLPAYMSYLEKTMTEYPAYTQ